MNLRLLYYGLFFLVLATILRWPTIPYIEAAPLDPNFPLHALAAKGLSQGEVFRLSYLEWPYGASMRYIAWPLLIIATPLNYIFSSIAAMNIAVWIWMWIQGIGGFWIGKRLNCTNSSSIFLGVGAMCAPISLISLGNGQYENIALFPLMWFCTAMYQKKSIFIPFLLCLFSSPYQGICALLAVPFFLTKKHWKQHFGEMIALLVCTYMYYAAVSSGQVHESVAPAGASLPEKAYPFGLFWPENVAQNGGVPLSGPIERLQNIFNTPFSRTYNHRWPWILATAGSYIGWSIWIAVFICMRKKNLVFLCWGALCLLLSFGSTLGSSTIPMPWSILSLLPSLEKMQATIRFLSGLSAALLMIVALRNHKYTLFFIPFLILEALLLSPIHWPVRAKTPLPSEKIQQITEPVAFWPAAPIIASHKVTMSALMLEKPLALFAEKYASMPNANGLVQRTGAQVNRLDQSPEEWRNTLCAQKVTKIIQFRDIVGSEAQPFVRGVQAMREHCDEHFCLFEFCPSQPQKKP